MSQSLMNEIYLNEIKNFVSYLTENTLRLHPKN
jgi:hypothetical protein